MPLNELLEEILRQAGTDSFPDYINQRTQEIFDQVTGDYQGYDHGQLRAHIRLMVLRCTAVSLGYEAERSDIFDRMMGNLTEGRLNCQDIEEGHDDSLQQENALLAGTDLCPLEEEYFRRHPSGS